MGYAPDLPDGVRQNISKVDAMIVENAKKKANPPVSQTPEEIEAERVERERLAAEEAEKQRLEAEVKVGPDGEMVSKAEFDKLQQELATLKGKYDKEPTELARQNSFLQSQVQTLQEQVIQLVTQLKDKPPEKKREADPTFREIIKNDPIINEQLQDASPSIVEGMIGIAERAYALAQERGNQAAKELIHGEVSRIDQTMAKTREQLFFEAIEKEHPNWKQIWAEPTFQAYGNEVDETFGVPRFAAILTMDEKGQVFFKDLNARAVINFINKATGNNASALPPGNKKTELDPNDPKIAGKINPPRSSGRSDTTTTSSNTMTPTQAKEKLIALREEKGSGRYNGTTQDFDKEFARLTAIIMGKRAT